VTAGECLILAVGHAGQNEHHHEQSRASQVQSLPARFSGIFFQKFAAVEIRPQLHADQRRREAREDGQTPRIQEARTGFSGKKFQKFAPGAARAVGIGTASPAATFSVVGSGYLTGGL